MAIESFSMDRPLCEIFGQPRGTERFAVTYPFRDPAWKCVSVSSWMDMILKLPDHQSRICNADEYPMPVEPLTRRSFLKMTGTAAAGFGAASLLPQKVWSRPAGSNEAIGVAVVGLAYGNTHINRIRSLPGVRLTAICDLDPRMLQGRVTELKAANVDVFACTDFRELLERKDVDAIVIATSNHWHALHTIWACQAGKDVYVEKPVAHTVWEGRKMIEAAERYDRIVQAGTQARSAHGLPELIEYLKEGHLGKMLYVHAISSRRRGGIGKKLPWYPEDIDFDAFCGPAPVVPLERNRWRYDWHWMWDTGNGDLGNLGIHFYDRAVWVAGHQGPPPRVRSLGARLGVDDAGETPNAQLTICEYPDVPIIIENRSMPAAPGVTDGESVRGLAGGIIVQCEGGYFAGGNGGHVYDREGRAVREFPTSGAANHMKNFLDAVRSRSRSDLKAPIDVAHVSNIGCLTGNISCRLGSPAGREEIREALEGSLPDPEMLPSFEDYLERMGVDLGTTPLSLGPWLDFDGAKETFTAIGAPGTDEALERARFLLKGSFRPPYQIPDTV
jgi:predicted dehydrogenase